MPYEFRDLWCGRSKAEFARFLQEAIASGMLSGFDISIDRSKITGDGTKSRAL